MSNEKAARFSHVYLANGGLSNDSNRMRRRLAKCIEKNFDPAKTHGVRLGLILEDELGIQVVRQGPYASYVNWVEFLENVELRDVLDTLFIAQKVRGTIGGEEAVSQMWKHFKRIIAEERVAFILDDEGGVHPQVDEMFEAGRLSAIEVLNAEKYTAAREHLRAIDDALLGNPSDGRAAIRASFDVAENIFKLAFASETQLNNSSIERKLKPMIERKFSGDQTELRVNQKILNGFKNWVEAAHFYRHEAGQADPIQSSEPTVTSLLAEGYARIRWLAHLVN